MNEVIQIAFNPVNLIFTFLLILVVLYWLSIIIGVLDFGSLDIDFDMDTDLDIEVDVETEIQTGGAGNLAGALQFFNFGKLPFMVIMSFLILSSWTISMLVNHYFGGGSALFALALVIPNLFVSLCFTKIITTPLIPVFENLDNGIDPVDYIGMSGKLVLSVSPGKMGQAQVLIDDSPLLLNVKLENESSNILEKGAEVIVIQKGDNNAHYIVKPLNE